MGGSNGSVLELITAGVLAGAYGSLARTHPEAARGLEKMRVKWSAETAILADRVCEESRHHAAASSGKFNRANSPKW